MIIISFCTENSSLMLYWLNIFSKKKTYIEKQKEPSHAVPVRACSNYLFICKMNGYLAGFWKKNLFGDNVSSCKTLPESCKALQNNHSLSARVLQRNKCSRKFNMYFETYFRCMLSVYFI